MPASQQIAAVSWGLAVGIALIAIVWATVKGGWFRQPLKGDPRSEDSLPEPIEPVHDFPDGISEAHGPVPLIVRIVIVSFVLWTIAYVVMFVQRGYTFS
ncbi:MAG: hypothetical protein HGB10_10105 [Coriobacteriia bacterium]|nr:hypothetical protein [Coriobacteriia bacterium]